MSVITGKAAAPPPSELVPAINEPTIMVSVIKKPVLNKYHRSK